MSVSGGMARCNGVPGRHERSLLRPLRVPVDVTWRGGSCCCCLPSERVLDRLVVLVLVVLLIRSVLAAGRIFIARAGSEHHVTQAVYQIGEGVKIEQIGVLSDGDGVAVGVLLPLESRARRSRNILEHIRKEPRPHASHDVLDCGAIRGEDAATSAAG